ncbi:methyltransferase domain-containing protein [Isoptericola sp. b515]|uniref:class I SAM-dependent methyltransferase n=1 Tax=Isoptericola sp. b515 TaxID=3064652 RepID=UPI002712B4B5|nr:methyltransferase domain-containing protein [Isoptericola sp. b515]MDO8147532.1 methyltransferase domain-containing protein [Isoptericola sp. b515]
MPRPVHRRDDVRPEEADHDYLPGLPQRWLLPWYDLVARVRGVHRMYRRTVEIAGVVDDAHVLDVGCGTGNLSREVLRAAPDAVVTGLDPDGDALRRAARKLRRGDSGEVTLIRGFAHRLPVPDASQDHVVSSLALHHVPLEEKRRLAAEILRVLRRGGRVTIADFAGDHAAGHGDDGGTADAQHGDGAHAHRTGRGHRHGRGHQGHGGAEHQPGHGPGSTAYDADNADGGIEKLLTEAGLRDACAVERMPLLGDSVVFVQAQRA